MLRQHHQLPDKQVKRLYRVLHIYSLGFHEVVDDVCMHAAQRQQLLLAVWKAFSQLWQDALQVSLSVLPVILPRPPPPPPSPPTVFNACILAHALTVQGLTSSGGQLCGERGDVHVAGVGRLYSHPGCTASDMSNASWPSLDNQAPGICMHASMQNYV